MLPLLSLAVLAWAQDPAATPDPPSVDDPVVLVRLQGPLDESWASILRRAEEECSRLDAQALVLELDTPGGEMDLMKRLGDRLDDISRVRTTLCLIDRNAVSAGAYLAISCDEIWMVPAAVIGAATPISIGPGGLPLQLDEEVEEKLMSYGRAEFRAWAEKHGRDPVLAEAFVDPEIELQLVSVRGEQRTVNRDQYDDLIRRGEQPSFLKIVSPAGKLLTLDTNQALDYGYCDGTAVDRAALLEARGWSDLVVELEANWSEELARSLGSWSWLFMLAAAFFLVVSFQMPGLGAPEIAAAVCVLIFLFHGYVVGLAEWTEILLVVAGLALVAAEIFLMPGTLVLGVTGALMLLGGVVLAMQDFGWPSGAIQGEVFRDNLMRLLMFLIVAPMLSIFLVRRFTRTRAGSFLSVEPSPDFAGSVAGSDGRGVEQVPAGARGRCLTPLRPAGRVEIDGEPYDAISQGDFLTIGQGVRVLGRSGISLLVAPEEESSA